MRNAHRLRCCWAPSLAWQPRRYVKPKGAFKQVPANRATAQFRHSSKEDLSLAKANSSDGSEGQVSLDAYRQHDSGLFETEAWCGADFLTAAPFSHADPTMPARSAKKVMTKRQQKFLPAIGAAGRSQVPISAGPIRAKPQVWKPARHLVLLTGHLVRMAFASRGSG
jgi:hypothetical protein